MDIIGQSSWRGDRIGRACRIRFGMLLIDRLDLPIDVQVEPELEKVLKVRTEKSIGIEDPAVDSYKTPYEVRMSGGRARCMLDSGRNADRFPFDRAIEGDPEPWMTGELAHEHSFQHLREELCTRVVTR